jgi:hypothetical protein
MAARAGFFIFADFDPSGYSMPKSISRKLQGLCQSHFPGLDVHVRRCALMKEQVQELGLPSTPLKETEKRADRWREKMDMEQTEIDALATLRPDVLTDIVTLALTPYWDDGLEYRTRKAERAIAQVVQDIIARELVARGEDVARARALHKQAVVAASLAFKVIKPLMRDVAEAARAAIPDIEMPEPEPEPEGDVDEPLFDSRGDWMEQTRKLLDEKL